MMTKNSHLLIAIVGLFTLAPVSSQALDRLVSTSGSCTRFAAPDRGQVTLTAEARNKDPKAATERATAIYEKTLAAVKKLGLQDLELKTTEVQLSPIQEWIKNKPVIREYQSRLGLRVTTSSLQKLGDVVSTATAQGITETGSLSMQLSPEKLRAEQAACLQAATEDARAKAQKLAEAAGASLGKVASLSETGGVQPHPMMAESMVAMKSSRSAQDMSPAPIETGKQEIAVSVQASWELK